MLLVVWKNLFRNPLRTSLTVAAVAVATFAFVLLRTVTSSWGAQATGKMSVVVSRARASLLMTFPIRAAEEVRALPGVAHATPMLFLGGRIVGREEEDFLGLAVEPASFLDVYADHMELAPGDRECWQRSRDGVLMGERLAATLKYKRGDRLSLLPGFAAGAANVPMPLQVCGVYVAKNGADDEAAFLRFEYVNEYLAPARKNQVTLITTKLDRGADAAEVSRRIDAHFETGETPTTTVDETTFAKNFMSVLRTVLQAIAVINGVLLALIGLVVGNAIAMSVRERTGEYGILRAVGFSSGSIFWLITGEAAFVCALGGLAGVAAAFVLVNFVVGPALEAGSNGLFSSFRAGPAALGSTFLAATALGFVSAAPAAVGALRVRAVDALRSVG